MDFSVEAFPYAFECRCGRKETVTRAEAIDLAPHATTPAEASECVMMAKHGWWASPETGALICPECVEDLVAA